MKTISPRGKRRRPLEPGVLLGAPLFLIALFVVVFSPGAAGRVRGVLLPLGAPLLSLKEEVGRGFESLTAYFSLKRRLLAENEALREETQVLKNRVMNEERLLAQNAELLGAFGRLGAERAMVAGVTSAPPRSPYDTLVIDAGARDGLRRGDVVFAPGPVRLGTIEDVYPAASLVRLLSFPGDETAVTLGRSGTVALAKGSGGGNLTILLPTVVFVETGETLQTMGLDGMPIGVVAEVEIDAASPFQTVRFRLPVNIGQLRFVFVRAAPFSP